MTDNIYDNPVFFDKYSRMSRSKDGLQGAGEWETLKKILPNFKDTTVLDLGCGYGWHCLYALEQGAKEVIGVDISVKMLEKARELTHSNKVTYVLKNIDSVVYPDETFDIILSSLALHYIEDYKGLVENVKNMLKDKGTFIFTVEHPVFTAEGSQNWYYENGAIKHFPVDNYYYEGKREANFLGEAVTKYHRTLTTYLNTLIEHGFILEQVVEPMSPKHLMHIEGMPDEMRRPMMLIVSAKKVK